MTINEQIKILDNKIRSNQAQYDLDRQLKEDLLINAKTFYDGREMIIKAFRDKLFPLRDPSNYPHYTESDSEKDKVSSTDKSCKSLTDELDEILSPGLVSK